MVKRLMEKLDGIGAVWKNISDVINRAVERGIVEKIKSDMGVSAEVRNDGLYKNYRGQTVG
jgi:hypothetical protein